MSDTLRDRQRQVAQEMILEAAADEIVDRGLEAVSLQAVADRAGVSKRTLYNYFDSRETLLAALPAWSDALTVANGGALVPEGLDTLPDMVRAVWRTWQLQGTIHEAALRIDAGSNDSGVSDGRRARRAALATAVKDIRTDLTDEQCRRLASLLHAIGSAPTYRRLHLEDGIDLDVASDLAAWALRIIHQSLEQGSDPFTKEDS